MLKTRIVTTALIATASSLWAQLPPSSLTPTRPAQPVPVRPEAPPAPVVPGGNAAVPASTVDLSNTIPNTLTAEEAAQGWKLLFDGNRLIGMRGVQRNDPLSAGWKIQNGELTLPKDVKEMDKLTGGDLITVEQFWDFEFRFDWKTTVSANSGIRYLVSTAIGQAPSGLEYQIIDDVHNTIGLKGGPLRRTGALDNVLPVGANARLRTADPLNKRTEPWNEGRIVVRGNHVEHWLNGDKVLEFDLSPTLRGQADKNFDRDEPFAVRPHGLFGSKAKTPLVLLDQGTELSFRNLKVRQLVPLAVVQPPATNGPATGVGQRTQPPNPFLLPTNPKR